MTIKILPSTTPEIIREAKKAGVIAGKVYPEGVTTNSEDGVKDFESLFQIFKTMEEVSMVLCLHGETPNDYVLDREKNFLDTLFWISRSFPKLNIVLEHITTEDAVRSVYKLPNVAATITIHHLLITLHDILCDKSSGSEALNPHHYCKPVAKHPHDREALIRAALSGSSKFFYGGDSAPHLREKKESDCGCAGVFNAPVALSLLAQFFEDHNALDKLEPFVSQFGAEFYGLPLNEGTITLIKRSWKVPQDYCGIVPFYANKTLAWSVE